jgi:pimeloyl-ACP methyl ester carboxylesterase
MAATTGGMTVRRGEFVTSDGVRLAYDDAGSGSPAILLVHGMACDRTQMRAQLEHLAPRHRVVAVDMRGHGESDKPVGDYSRQVLGGDLLQLSAALGLDRPVVIGHSLGGSVALHAAVAHPGAFRGVVLLDSGMRRLEDKAAELGPFYEQLGGPDHDRLVQEFVLARLFEPVDDPAVAEAVAVTMGAVPAHAFLAMAADVVTTTAASAALAYRDPALLIMSKRPFLSDGVLDRLGDNWMVGRVVDAGHFIQMLVPEQVNPMLDRFLRQFKDG